MNPRHYHGEDIEVLAQAIRYRAWILDVFAPFLKGRCLEIGAGMGTFSAEILPHVTALDLVEPAENLLPGLKARFTEAQQVRLFPQTLEGHLAQPPKERPDVAVLINVLEHIEDDGAVLGGLYRHLTAGGRLLIFVPAMPALFSQMDREVGHFRRYGKAELKERVRQAGFSIERLHYFDLLGVIPWWLLNTLLGSTRFNPAMVRLYDRLGVPLTRFLESLAAPPLGKNLILVAAK